MIGGNVHDNIFRSRAYAIVFTPATAIHIDQQTCSLLRIGCRKHLLHLEICLVSRQYFSQIGTKTIIANLAQCCILVVFSRMLHVNVKKITEPFRASKTVDVAGIQMIEDTDWISEAKTLT